MIALTVIFILLEAAGFPTKLGPTSTVTSLGIGAVGLQVESSHDFLGYLRGVLILGIDFYVGTSAINRGTLGENLLDLRPTARVSQVRTAMGGRPIGINPPK